MCQPLYPTLLVTAMARSYYLADELGMFNEQLLITLSLRRTDCEFRFHPRLQKLKGATALWAVWSGEPGLSVYGNYAEALEQGSSAPNNGTVDNLDKSSRRKPVSSARSASNTTQAFGLTIAFFDIERENALTINRVFGYFGQQRNRGLELNFFGEPVKGLRVLSGLIPPEVKADQCRGGGRSREAIGVPNYQVQLGELDIFHWVPGLTFTAGVAHHDNQFVDATKF